MRKKEYIIVVLILWEYTNIIFFIVAIEVSTNNNTVYKYVKKQNVLGYQ